MPVKPFVVEQPSVGQYIVTWTPLANGDTGAWFSPGPNMDINAEVYGTFGAGPNCRIDGTNDTAASPAAASILPVRDTADAAVNLTAAVFKQILTVPYQLRPNITAGDGTTSLTVKMRLTTSARR